MMERSLAFFQFDRHRLELFLLCIAQHGVDRLHLLREAGNRQEMPAMTTGNIMHAAVLARRIVQADPTGEMGHWCCPCPVGIILMPCYHAAVMRRLTEKLIMPEAYRATQQLRCGHQEGRAPKYVVKSGCRSPGS